jgi:hypothetical protein
MRCKTLHRRNGIPLKVLSRLLWHPSYQMGYPVRLRTASNITHPTVRFNSYWLDVRLPMSKGATSAYWHAWCASGATVNAKTRRRHPKPKVRRRTGRALSQPLSRRRPTGRAKSPRHAPSHQSPSPRGSKSGTHYGRKLPKRSGETNKEVTNE